MADKNRMSLSFDQATKDRLRAYAEARHTSVTQAITDWIWRQPVKPPPVDGEQEESDKDGKG